MSQCDGTLSAPGQLFREKKKENHKMDPDIITKSCYTAGFSYEPTDTQKGAFAF